MTAQDVEICSIKKRKPWNNNDFAGNQMIKMIWKLVSFVNELRTKGIQCGATIWWFTMISSDRVLFTGTSQRIRCMTICHPYPCQAPHTILVPWLSCRILESRPGAMPSPHIPLLGSRVFRLILIIFDENQQNLIDFDVFDQKTKKKSTSTRAERTCDFLIVVQRFTIAALLFKRPQEFREPCKKSIKMVDFHQFHRFWCNFDQKF